MLVPGVRVAADSTAGRREGYGIHRRGRGGGERGRWLKRSARHAAGSRRICRATLKRARGHTARCRKYAPPKEGRAGAVGQACRRMPQDRRRGRWVVGQGLGLRAAANPEGRGIRRRARPDRRHSDPPGMPQDAARIGCETTEAAGGQGRVGAKGRLAELNSASNPGGRALKWPVVKGRREIGALQSGRSGMPQFAADLKARLPFPHDATSSDGAARRTRQSPGRSIEHLFGLRKASETDRRGQERTPSRGRVLTEGVA
jgi:hypothetical protein